MRTDIERLNAAGLRLASDAHQLLEGRADAKEIVDRLLGANLVFVSKEDVEKEMAQQSKIPMPVEVAREPSFKPAAKDLQPHVKVVQDEDVSGKSRCRGTMDDFVSYFRNRFERMRSLLRTRTTTNPFVKTTNLKRNLFQKGVLVAMVIEKRITKKGDMVIEVEDDEGQALVFVSAKEKCFKDAKGLLNDDVVAFEGKITETFLIAEGIMWPDLPVLKERSYAKNDVAIVYLSDLHIGSKFFLEKEFLRFVSWLKGNEGNEQLAGKVKYIEIAGDIVDGIGVYPSQEKELVVRDIFKQYDMFARLMEEIPDYITIIASPGNHDAVRRAEPQPQLPSDILKESRVLSVGSPSRLDIEGMRHLVYHGTSLDSIISGICGLSYSKPEEPMLELLKRRHLSPVYGSNPIVPEGRDYMVINDEPDVVHMGHIHKNGSMLYRGTLLLNSGTFQARTEFQIRMGHVPSPCIVPILEAQSGKLTHISFKAEESK
ncbi:DNA-directed DNA polymerase II small subunit [Candidatus Micrarchaeota archaeon]|nr:DNA-directed DNA polymerase II small subunit [Candidatus Micrarchaeota archaeon]